MATFALFYFTSFLCIMDTGVGRRVSSAPDRHRHPTVGKPWGVRRYTGTFSCRAQPASPSTTLGSRNQFRPRDFSKLKPSRQETRAGQGGGEEPWVSNGTPGLYVWSNHRRCSSNGRQSASFSGVHSHTVKQVIMFPNQDRISVASSWRVAKPGFRLRPCGPRVPDFNHYICFSTTLINWCLAFFI